MEIIKEKYGIGLVALIITIIVLIILTGTVIMTMSKGDTIEKTKEAVFKSDITTYREELVRKKMDKKLKQETGETSILNLSPTTPEDVKRLLPNFKDEYYGVIEIIDGDLYIDDNISSENKIKYYTYLKECDIAIQWNIQIEDFTIDDNGIMTAYSGDSENVIIPNMVKTIQDEVFSGKLMKSVEIPNSVKSIGMCAFMDCHNLETVEMPNSIENIGEAAFLNCDLSKNITISNSLENIENDVFNSTNISNILIPDNIIRIGANAFFCSSLKSITIPSSVTNIGNNAFDGCTNLTSFIIKEGSMLDTSNASDWGIDSSIIVDQRL